MSEHGRHRMQFCVRLEKFAHGARREDEEERERRRLRRMIFMLTMTHRLCIRAGPSTLEAGRVTTLMTTLLPPVHAGLRSSRPRRDSHSSQQDALAAREETISFPLPSSVVTRDFFRCRRRRRLFPFREKSSCSAWRTRSARYRATRRSPVRTLTDGPAEAPTSFLPSGPHRRPTVGFAKFAVA